MSLACVYSRANVGVEAKLVEVEVHLSNSVPRFNIVGLPEAAVKESKDRVRSALVNCGFTIPLQKITVNLAPADLPKEGGRYDLAIALGILIASKQLPINCLTGYEVAGELALSGDLRPFSGCLPMVLAAHQQQRKLILPYKNACVASILQEAVILGAHSLLEVCQHLTGAVSLIPVQAQTISAAATYPDLLEVRGQSQARRALEIAAAGAHSLLMIGAPGSGKTMLANRLPGILPAMRDSEAIEVASLASLVGKGECFVNVKKRPFRSPHHSASHVALIGGGRQVHPGEVSLAHHGVLFLDELPEFSRAALEALREPLESGEVHVSRAENRVKYPASFQLIAAMNPCPCGYLGDEAGRCNCTQEQVKRYRAKLSGPLLDRIDLQVWVKALSIASLLQDAPSAESSATVRARVEAARQAQYQRANKLNARLSQVELKNFCKIGADEKKFMQQAIAKFKLSARAYYRVLRVARTLADLEQIDFIQLSHLQEVFMLRNSSILA